MKDCLITIQVANALRILIDSMDLDVPKGALGFRCPQCRAPVKPHQGGMQGPHFEHLKKNPGCPLSQKKSRAERS